MDRQKGSSQSSKLGEFRPLLLTEPYPETSSGRVSICKHQQWFGLDIHCSTLVLNFNNIFSIGHFYFVLGYT